MGEADAVRRRGSKARTASIVFWLVTDYRRASSSRVDARQVDGYGKWSQRWKTKEKRNEGLRGLLGPAYISLVVAVRRRHFTASWCGPVRFQLERHGLAPIHPALWSAEGQWKSDFVSVSSTSKVPHRRHHCPLNSALPNPMFCGEITANHGPFPLDRRPRKKPSTDMRIVMAQPRLDLELCLFQSVSKVQVVWAVLADDMFQGSGGAKEGQQRD